MISLYNNIPLELKLCRQWVCWGKNLGGTQKPSKIPHNPCTGKNASSTDPATWVTYEDAVRAVEAGQYAGIGYVLAADDPYTFIDLDDPKGSARLTELITRIYKGFASYSEISPSGNGLHIIIRGNIPVGRRKDNVEVYSDARYMTMTGNIYGTCTTIEGRQELLTKLWNEIGDTVPDQPDSFPNASLATESDEMVVQRALNAENGWKFNALWHGDASVLDGTDYSESCVEMSFLSILCFHTKDPDQIERIWLSSPLGQRKKVQTRPKYRRTSISKAFNYEFNRPEAFFEGGAYVIR